MVKKLNIFSFETRATDGNEVTYIGIIITVIRCANAYTFIFPSKSKDLK